MNNNPVNIHTAASDDDSASICTVLPSYTFQSQQISPLPSPTSAYHTLSDQQSSSSRSPSPAPTYCTVDNGQEVGIAAKNSRGNMPLHEAVQRGNETLLRRLLKKGADLNAKNVDEWTPLHMSAQGGHEAVMRLPMRATPLLLGKRANIAAKDWTGRTPLHIAAGGIHEPVVQL